MVTPSATTTGGRVVNRSRGTVLAGEARYARSFRERLFGLMGRAALPEGAALIFAPCRGVHTHFMRFPLDLVFVAREDGRTGRIVRVRERMAPFRADPGRSDLVLELPAGTIARTGTAAGDVVELPPTGAAGRGA